jgi:hypothetical protein
VPAKKPRRQFLRKKKSGLNLGNITHTEVYKSDKSVWAIAQKNMKCYTPAQNAEVRRQISITNKATSDYKTLLADKNLDYYSYDWRPHYEKYLSAVDWLKKIKSLPAPTRKPSGKNA